MIGDELEKCSSPFRVAWLPEAAGPEGAGHGMSGHQAQYAVREPGAVLPRGSERGAATRAGLLDAARAVFTSAGYTEAGITDIVTAAGASVGSLYHHFTGKADLYLTLSEEFHAGLTERTRGAVRRARDAGVA